jgi:hypothetical protein
LSHQVENDARGFVKRSQAYIGMNSGFFSRTTEKEHQ